MLTYRRCSLLTCLTLQWAYQPFESPTDTCDTLLADLDLYVIAEASFPTSILRLEARMSSLDCRLHDDDRLLALIVTSGGAGASIWRGKPANAKDTTSSGRASSVGPTHQVAT